MPVIRYVNNVSGNDTTGDGLTMGTAYASIARATSDILDASSIVLIADTGVDYVEDAASLPWPRSSYFGVSAAGLPSYSALPKIRVDGPTGHFFADNTYIKNLWLDGEYQVNGLHRQWGGISDVYYCRISNFDNQASIVSRTIRPVDSLFSVYENNAGDGAFTGGSGGAYGCIFYNNGNDGINCGGNNVTNCLALFNGRDGISMFGSTTSSLWSNNVSMYNGAAGFRYNHGYASQIDRSISAYNGTYGFDCKNASGVGFITNCISYLNTSGSLYLTTNTTVSGDIAEEFYFGPNGVNDDVLLGVSNLSTSDPEITLGASTPFNIEIPTTSPAYQFAEMPASLSSFISTPHGATALSIGPNVFNVFATGGGGSPVTRSWWG